MSDFRIRGSEDLAHGGFLTLSRVAVEGPESESITRHVVHHPGAVVVVPVDDDRRHVLLVRQWRVAADRELLEVVAGKRDVEHEPPEETARRELAEEIGKVAGHLVPLCEFYNSPGFCDEYSHLYCALDLDDTAERHPVRTEEAAMTVERIAIDDVDDLIATREIVDAKSIIGLQLTRRYLLGEYRGLRS
ncbi:MAG: NUDIX hydrolase [Actinobacteria bacterium]|nr:MAG: NUDIX hydrolase [Actinomycetota bacterium]